MNKLLCLRFKNKINIIENSCWEWTGALDHKGYGRFWDGIKNIAAHRYSYEINVGPIPGNLQLDHLCRNHKCVNPEHLEAVTGIENVHRGLMGLLAGHHNLIKNRCPQGHPYDEVNTYVFKQRGRGTGRMCRICKRNSMLADRCRRQVHLPARPYKTLQSVKGTT